jgi:hypothetical protein
MSGNRAELRKQACMVHDRNRPADREGRIRSRNSQNFSGLLVLMAAHDPGCVKTLGGM